MLWWGQTSPTFLCLQKKHILGLGGNNNIWVEISSGIRLPDHCSCKVHPLSKPLWRPLPGQALFEVVHGEKDIPPLKAPTAQGVLRSQQIINAVRWLWGWGVKELGWGGDSLLSRSLGRHLRGDSQD